MKKLIALLLALVMVFALCACGPKAPKGITLRIGYMPNYASLWAVMTGIKKGFFEEEGITIELTEFADGAAEIAAMEGGSIDLAYIGKGAHRLCILGNAIIFAPSSVHTEDKLVCAKDSGIQTVNDLKGKKIGYTAGSSSETTMDGGDLQPGRLQHRARHGLRLHRCGRDLEPLLLHVPGADRGLL